MRFKTGDKVEVMNNKEVLVSWCPAGILSASGHSYSVQYDYFPGIERDRLVEIVPRKLVRPRPPLVQGVESFVTGDIVEVFHQYSWKIAVILKVIRCGKESTKRKNHLKAVLQNQYHLKAVLQNQYLVRLLGCSEELVVGRSIIRTRQTWHWDKWTPVGKSFRAGNDAISNKPSTTNCCKNMKYHAPLFNEISRNQRRKCYAKIQDGSAFGESPVVSSRSLKRLSPYDSSVIGAHNGHVQKLRATEKEGGKQRVVADPVLEKVDAVAYPKETLGEKYMHSSYNILSHGYKSKEGAKQNDVLFSGVRGSEMSCSDSDACSVGSCSVNDQSPKNCYSHFVPVHHQEADTLCSDAESSYGSVSERKSCSLTPKEEVEVSIHRLELHAYRSTLGALHASGPLSWEQETLLTNLRIMLHISNDEHLKELKHLISNKTAFSVR